MSDQEKVMSVFTAMSGTGRRLKRWGKEGLLNDQQILSILEFEKHNQGVRFFRSLVGLAIFAIGVGVLSIVAANWVHIPGGAKIFLHFLLNIGAAMSIWQFAQEDKKIWREGATLLFFALNLTMIVLIGQVFQLSGNYATALSVWVVISTPAVFLYGRTAINAVPWMIAFLTAFAFVFFEIMMVFDNEFLTFLLALAVGLYVPLLLMLGGVNKALQAHRVEWSLSFFRASMLLFAVGGTVGSFFWYEGLNGSLDDVFKEAGSFATGYVSMLAVIASAPILVYGYEALMQRAGKKIIDRSIIIFVIGSLISATLPLVLMAAEIEVVAAIHFVAYWIFAGWIGDRMGVQRLVNTAITMVTLRIMVVYFELFGGLMLTGFGLIFSGILMLAILKGAMNFKKKISE